MFTRYFDCRPLYQRLAARFLALFPTRNQRPALGQAEMIVVDVEYNGGAPYTARILDTKTGAMIEGITHVDISLDARKLATVVLTAYRPHLRLHNLKARVEDLHITSVEVPEDDSPRPLDQIVEDLKAEGF